LSSKCCCGRHGIAAMGCKNFLIGFQAPERLPQQTAS
jgi:hypothetical protein